MNERILELAVQARLHSPLLLQHWRKIDALTDSEQEELKNIEKFAELIVQECLSQVDKVDAMLDDDKEKTGVAWVGLAIAKHFGVEE